MKKNNRKILILYSQLAGYLVSNLNYFLELNPESQIDIIYYPKSINAPFDFQLHNNIKLHDRKKHSNKSLTKLVDNINPDLALVSGWFDNSYLKISKKLKKNGKPTVCVIDNFFTGSTRQIFGLFPLKLLLRSCFSNAWVPGIRQYSYANLLGFRHKSIQTGFYCADLTLFEKNDKDIRLKKGQKNLLYVGRLVKYKWINELVDTFLTIKAKYNLDWSLTVVGNGPLENKLPESEYVKYIKFTQPEDLYKLALNAHAFVLPSIHENFGVTLHEFAATGLPILCSDNIGAQSEFVINNYNGWVFNSGSKISLKKTLHKMMNCNHNELEKMGNKSIEMSKKINKNEWCQTLLNYANN